MAVNSTPAETQAAELHPVDYSDIGGWSADTHGEAFAAFLRGCAAILGRSSDRFEKAMHEVCRAATRLAHDTNDAAARAFFEEHFAPHLVLSHGQNKGLITGYFEPVIKAARTGSSAFPVPLLGPPDGLIAVNKIAEPVDLPSDLTHAISTSDGYVAAPTRAQISAGELTGRAPIIAWLADPIDAFFLHIQGSGRLTYADGSSERVTYAGKNGYPYTSIGAVLVERGVMNREQVSMDSLRAWLAADPQRGEALMNENRSFIFFRRADKDDPKLGPTGQLEVPLTPGRSLAVDLAYYASNLPVWLDTSLPATSGDPGGKLQRLMIAQDTGSAIRGPIRGDVFFGSGDLAGASAGAMRAEGRMIALIPRCVEC